ncbi:unnamed protein product, partial [Candidula unifasciata]
ILGENPSIGSSCLQVSVSVLQAQPGSIPVLKPNLYCVAFVVIAIQHMMIIQ